MIRVGFCVSGDSSWTGGVNYLRNLLYAVSLLKERRIEPVVIAGNRTDPRVLALYKSYAEIVAAPFLDEKTVPWLLHTLQSRLAGTDSQLNRLVFRQNIRILSHSPLGVRRKPFYRSIGWIPDFQHLHLPEMYTGAELGRRNASYLKLAKHSNVVVLSSNDALADYRKFAPQYAAKGRVLHFVAQPTAHTTENVSRAGMENKYGFSGKFFCLPNQFWKHKNHRTVFEAVKILAQRGERILVLCTGHMEDYRNRDHVASLIEFVKLNRLDDLVRFLGLIDAADLTWLMRNSVAVINPSLFEGWSTTVEESKSIGKGMVLSDLRVHREQDPPGSVYFDPRDPEALADILLERWSGSEGGPDIALETTAGTDLERRTLEFATAYQDIVLDLVRELEA